MRPQKSIYTEAGLFPFFYAFVAGHILVALPLRAIQLTSDPLLLGSIGTCLQGAIVLFCFICGRLSDYIPRWKMIVAGPLLCGTFILMMSVAVNIFQLILLSGLLGVAGAIFWPALEALIADHSSQSRLAHNLSIFNLSWASGHTLGNLLSGVLVTLGIVVPFVGAGTGGLLLGLGILWYYTKRQAEHSPTARPDACSADELYDPRSQHFLFLARIASFGIYFTVGSIRWLFPKLGTDLGLSSQAIGGLMAILMGTQTVIFFAMGQTTRWQFSILPLFVIPGVAMVALAFLAKASSMPVFIPAFSLIGVCSGVFYTMALFYGLHTPSQRGSRAGLHETIIGSGSLAGPILGGGIARLFGLRAPIYLCMGVVLLIVLLQIGLWLHYTGENRYPEMKRWRTTRRRA